MSAYGELVEMERIRSYYYPWREIGTSFVHGGEN
jgi:hypothetical protein